MADETVGTRLFQSALEQSNLNQRRAYFSGLVSLLIAVLAVLISSNSLSPESVNLFGTQFPLRDIFFVKIVVVVGSALSGIVTLIFVLEAVGDLIRIEYYGSIGIEEARIYSGYSGFNPDSRLSKYTAILTIILSVTFFTVVFVVPIFCFFYFK